MSKIDFIIDSCYDNIDPLGSCIERLAAELFDEQQSYQIKLTVYEAVTNCIEHGYQGSPEHKVWVTCQLGIDCISLDIADTGIAMDPLQLENTSTSFQVDPDDLCEGGMGLKIIKLFMDDINYSSRDGLNHFILVKYSKPQVAATGNAV